MKTENFNPADFDPLNSTAWMELIASALQAKGLDASVVHTGGGIYCISILKQDKGELLWGMAAETWGADDNDADGDLVGDGNGVWTRVSCDSTDIADITAAIYDASVAHGAAVHN